MPRPESASIRSFDDIAAISQHALNQLIPLCQNAIQARGLARISLSGGSTPKLLYQLMARHRDQFDWKSIELYWGDERNVPHDSDESNYRMVKEALLDHVPIPESNVFPVPIEVDEPAAVAKKYDETLQGQFGYTSPCWDLVLLGMGDDAHTASLFPETSALGVDDRLFVENWVPKFDAYRMTLTAPAINSAREVWFMIGGANKRESLGHVWGDKHDPHHYPSQLINASNGSVHWMLTRDAMP